MIDDLSQKILQMWQEGKSGTEIGKTLGLTRSAVLGRIARMREKENIGYKVSKVFVKTNRVVRTGDKVFPYKRLREKIEVQQRIVASVEHLVPKSKTLISILDLKHWSCRYIAGDETKPLDRIYCGQEIEIGSYCKDHAAICYRPVISK